MWNYQRVSTKNCGWFCSGKCWDSYSGSSLFADGSIGHDPFVFLSSELLIIMNLHSLINWKITLDWYLNSLCFCYKTEKPQNQHLCVCCRLSKMGHESIPFGPEAIPVSMIPQDDFWMNSTIRCLQFPWQFIYTLQLLIYNLELFTYHFQCSFLYKLQHNGPIVPWTQRWKSRRSLRTRLQAAGLSGIISGGRVSSDQPMKRWMVYPLAICYIAMEDGLVEIVSFPMFNGKTHSQLVILNSKLFVCQMLFRFELEWETWWFDTWMDWGTQVWDIPTC